MAVNEQLLGLLSFLRDTFTSEFRAWCGAIPARLDAIRDAFIATIGCCFSGVDATMPTLFSKANRPASKPKTSVLAPSSPTVMEGAMTLQPPALPPTAPQNDGDDDWSPTESPQEPSAFLEMVDIVDTTEPVASIQGHLAVMHVNDHDETAQTLHTIVEEPESRGASPAISLTTEEATHFMTAINDVMESSIEALETVATVEQHLEDLNAFGGIDACDVDVHQPSCIDSGLPTEVSDAEAEDAQSSAVQASATSAHGSTTEEPIEDEGAEDVFHDAQDDTEGQLLATNASAAEEYGSDEDEGSSVYSFATTAPSFAGDENKAPSIVSSPFWEEPNFRVRDVASPLRPAWNPDWMEQHRSSPVNVETHDEPLNEDGCLDANPGDLSPSSKGHEELALSRHDEIRTAEIVVEDPTDIHHVEDAGEVAAAKEPTELTEEVDEIENLVSASPSTDAGATMPVGDSDVASLNGQVVDEAMPAVVNPMLASPPRSYVPAFAGVPTTTLAKGVSYRQLAVELTPASEDEPSFYRVALQKLKQERKLRRLNPTVTEPVMSAPSSNSSIYDYEDEKERCARLKKIDELRKRTSGFEVKIGKPLSIGRVPYAKS